MMIKVIDENGTYYIEDVIWISESTQGEGVEVITKDKEKTGFGFDAETTVYTDQGVEIT